MSFAVAEIVGKQVEGLNHEALSHIRQLRQFVSWAESRFFDPMDASTEVPSILNELADPAWELHEQLEKLGQYNEEAAEMATILENEIEACIARFWKWSKRTFMTAQEAAEKYGKHRTTIYRWIKKGKIRAEKDERGRWKILA